MPNASGMGIYVFPDDVPRTKQRYVFRWCAASEKWKIVAALNLRPGCIWRNSLVPSKNTLLRAQQVKTEHEKRDALCQSKKQKLVETLNKKKIAENLKKQKLENTNRNKEN